MHDKCSITYIRLQQCRCRDHQGHHRQHKRKRNYKRAKHARACSFKRGCGMQFKTRWRVPLGTTQTINKIHTCQPRKSMQLQTRLRDAWPEPRSDNHWGIATLTHASTHSHALVHCCHSSQIIAYINESAVEYLKTKFEQKSRRKARKNEIQLKMKSTKAKRHKTLLLS